MRAAIIGLGGAELGPAEAALLRACPPAGVILFARNIVDPAQLAALVAHIREACPQTRLMLDQEGGRVARLRPPHWRTHPSAAAIGASRDAQRLAWLTGALIGADGHGFDVVTAPVLDLAVAGADAVIGDRAYAADPDRVAELGRAMADGLLAAGIEPVAKHVPGHGRARADSHRQLPVLDAVAAADLVPFARNADLPWMMTAHILYTADDPEHPATLSPNIIRRVIRERLGFDGVLVSDDLAMGALHGTPGERAARALAAGCDLALHCSGVLEDSEQVLRAAPPITAATARRLQAARAQAQAARQALDVPALLVERDRLL